MSSQSLWVSISHGLGLWEWQTFHSKHWWGRGTTKMCIVEHDGRIGEMLAVLPWETKLKMLSLGGKCLEPLCSRGGELRVPQLAGLPGYLNQWAKAQWETFSLQIRWAMIEKNIQCWPLASTHMCTVRKVKPWNSFLLAWHACCSFSLDCDYLHGTTTKLGH